MLGIALAGAFLGGVVLHDVGADRSTLWLVLAAALLIAIGLPAQRQRVMLVALLAFGVAGALRAGSLAALPSEIGSSSTGAARIRATVDGVNARTAERVRARVHRLDDPSKRFDVWLPVYPAVVRGDIVRLTVLPGGRQPDSGVRLDAATGDGAFFATSLAIQGNQATWPVRLRQRVNDSLARRVQAGIPEPAGALALGVLNGDDSGMTTADRARFRAAGFSHITAVSGWNVSVVTGFIALLARRLPLRRHVRFGSILLITWGYAFMVGMSPSVTRAAALTTIVVVAHWRGRARDPVTGLLWATAAIVAATPALRFDIGFQLSVAATMGLALVAPHLDGRPAWQQALLIPLAAEIAVTPLLLHHFGTFSLVSPLDNLLVAPLIVPTALGGFVVVLASLIHPALAQAFGLLAWVPGRLIILVAEVAARVDGASGTTLNLGQTATLAVYLVVAAVWIGLSWWRPATPTPTAAAANP